MDEPSPDGRLQLRPSLSLELYVSTAPCGDGRTFTAAEAAGGDFPTHPAAPHRPFWGQQGKHGMLRSKLERGEGTTELGAEEAAVQTLDGVKGGERLRTMSCSDKILLWNTLGIQGALLSWALEPVKESETARDCHAKSPGISLNWNQADGSVELVDTFTGLVNGLTESRLCKLAFLQLALDMTGDESMEHEHLFYGQLKTWLGKEYGLAKRSFEATLEEAGLGRWVHHPHEERQFRLQEAHK